MNSVAEYVLYYAGITPEKCALADENSAITYKELSEYAFSVSNYLKSKGVKFGDIVAVECVQDTTVIVIKLALEICGAIFVPVEKGIVSERLSTILEETKAILYVGNKPDITVNTLCLSLSDIKDNMSENEDGIKDYICEFKPDDVSEVLFSTGTTGNPKGIIISNRNNIAIAENVIESIKIPTDAVEIVPLPLSHSHALRSTYSHLVNGSTAVFVNGISNISIFFDLIDKYCVNAMDVSPTILKVLLAIASKGVDVLNEKLIYIQIGTSVLDEELKAKVAKRFEKVRVYNSYGMTEAGRSCALEIKETADKGCVGYATKNAKFLIVNPNTLEPIESSSEKTGIVAVAGDILCKGYWNNKELTENTIRNGILYTNDVGYIDCLGRLYILGRSDDVINYKGIKIMPEEIESIAIKYEGVTDCGCIPVEDSMCGQVPKLYISVKNEISFELHSFEKWLSGNIEQIRMPKEIEIIEEIPRTYNGKLQRKKLMERDRSAK